MSQGDIVANSLAGYLQRHTEIESVLTKHGNMSFYTTDDTSDFDNHATAFFGAKMRSVHLHL